MSIGIVFNIKWLNDLLCAGVSLKTKLAKFTKKYNKNYHLLHISEVNLK